MNKPPTSESPECWDAASSGYAEKVAPLLMSAFADAFIERLAPDPGAHALEVGAGSGALTHALAERVGSLLATDFSPKMIELLEHQLSAAGARNVTCQVMNGQALAADDDSFDVAATSFALMLFPDRARGFTELCRVLRPGGRAMVSAWAGPERFEAFGLLQQALHAAFPDLPPPPAPPPIFSLADPVDFKVQMEAAGFTDVTVDFVERELTVSGFDHLWGMLTVGAPPVQALFDRVGEQGRERLRDALATIVAQRFGQEAIVTTNVATVGVGTAR